MTISDDLVIHHVELSAAGSAQIYVATLGVGALLDDPTVPALRAEIMETDVFESRAAEYGIDPNSDGGWDDILHLVFASHDEGTGIATQLTDPDHLFNAPSVEHARRVEMRRIRKAMGARTLRGEPGISDHRILVGEATRLLTSEAEDPIEFIKRTAPMSAEHIAVKAENIRRIRHQFKARRLGLNPNRAYTPEELDAHAKRRAVRLNQAPVRESADQLATRLLGAPLGEARSDRLPPRAGTLSKYL